MRTLLPALILLLTLPASAQERVEPDRLGGVWEMSFDLDASSEESAIGRIAKKALAGVMDEVIIRFAFMDDSRLRVMVDAFGEKDEDWAEWHISRDGYLVLGENEHFNAEETVWYFQGDSLVAYELDEDGKTGEVKGLTLERIGT